MIQIFLLFVLCVLLFGQLFKILVVGRSRDAKFPPFDIGHKFAEKSSDGRGGSNNPHNRQAYNYIIQSAVRLNVYFYFMNVLF